MNIFALIHDNQYPGEIYFSEKLDDIEVIDLHETDPDEVFLYGTSNTYAEMTGNNESPDEVPTSEHIDLIHTTGQSMVWPTIYTIEHGEFFERASFLTI